MTKDLSTKELVDEILKECEHDIHQKDLFKFNADGSKTKLGAIEICVNCGRLSI